MGTLDGVIKLLERADVKRFPQGNAKDLVAAENVKENVKQIAEDLVATLYAGLPENEPQGLEGMLGDIRAAQVEGAIRVQTALVEVAQSIGEQPNGDASLQESLTEFTQKIAAEFTQKLDDLIERPNKAEKWEFEIERNDYSDLITSVTATKQGRNS